MRKEKKGSSIFHAKLQLLEPMLAYLREKFVTLGLSPSESRRCEIALEEVLVNIINYAYDGDAGDLKIEYHATEDELHITIHDKGRPFNPLEQAGEYDTTLSLEERNVGGLGILFMKNFMDSVSYRREGDTNTLLLTKKLR